MNAGSPVQTALIIIKKKKSLALCTRVEKKIKIRAYHRSRWLWRPGAAAAAAALPDVGGSGGWHCQYPVAPTANVAVARLVGVFATVMGVLSYLTAIPVVVGAGAYDGRGGGLARGMRSESVGDGRGGHVHVRE